MHLLIGVKSINTKVQRYSDGTNIFAYPTLPGKSSIRFFVNTISLIAPYYISLYVIT